MPMPSSSWKAGTALRLGNRATLSTDVHGAARFYAKSAYGINENFVSIVGRHAHGNFHAQLRVSRQATQGFNDYWLIKIGLDCSTRVRLTDKIVAGTPNSRDIVAESSDVCSCLHMHAIERHW